MSDLKQLEEQLEETQYSIQLKNEMETLIEHPLFRKLILDGFCRDECTRLVHLSIDTNVPEAIRQDAIAHAQAGGYLMKHIQIICARGNRAEGEIYDLQQSIEAARQEA